MSIRLKLFLGFGALIILSGLQGGLAVKESLGLGHLVADTYDKSLMTINFARSAQSNFLLAEALLTKHANEDGLVDMDIEEFTDAAELVVENLEIAKERTSTTRSTELVDKLMALNTSWTEAAVAGIEELAGAENSAEASAELLTSLSE